MVDTLLRELPHVENSKMLGQLEVVKSGYVYLALHRPSNKDDAGGLMDVISGEISKKTSRYFCCSSQD